MNVANVKRRNESRPSWILACHVLTHELCPAIKTRVEISWRKNQIQSAKRAGHIPLSLAYSIFFVQRKVHRNFVHFFLSFDRNAIISNNKNGKFWIDFLLNWQNKNPCVSELEKVNFIIYNMNCVTAIFSTKTFPMHERNLWNNIPSIPWITCRILFFYKMKQFSTQTMIFTLQVTAYVSNLGYVNQQCIYSHRYLIKMFFSVCCH